MVRLGMGIERITMLRYQIGDLRHFFEATSASSISLTTLNGVEPPVRAESQRHVARWLGTVNFPANFSI